MAKPKTTIIYALSSSMAALIAGDVADARNRGLPVRLIAIDQFRGETEQNAGAVYVERSEKDELLFDAIAQAYPHMEVQDLSDAKFGGVELATPVMADEELKGLRLALIGMGGTAPAGASADELRSLIQEHAIQGDGPARIPVLPTPASQGTVIPDSTPVVLKADGDKTVSAAAVGSTEPVIAAATEATGEAPVTTHVAAFTPPVDAGATPAPAAEPTPAPAKTPAQKSGGAKPAASTSGNK